MPEYQDPNVAAIADLTKPANPAGTPTAGVSTATPPVTANPPQGGSQVDGQAVTVLNPVNAQGTVAPPQGQGDGAAKPQESPKLDPAALKAALSLKHTDEDTGEVLKRQYEASSREAKRLAEERKHIESLFAEQGLKFAKDDEGKPQLVRVGKKGEPVSVDYASLDRKAKEQFDAMFADPENVSPDKAWGFVANALKSQFTTVNPTVDRIVEPLSAERQGAAFEFVATKFKTLYPSMASEGMRDLLLSEINDAPPAIRRAFFEAPEAVLRLYAANLEAVVAAGARERVEAQQRQEQKKLEQARAAGIMSPSTMTVNVNGGNGRDSTATLDALLKAAGRR
jgi:hypothetical protein